MYGVYCCDKSLPPNVLLRIRVEWSPCLYFSAKASYTKEEQHFFQQPRIDRCNYSCAAVYMRVLVRKTNARKKPSAYAQCC